MSLENLNLFGEVEPNPRNLLNFHFFFTWGRTLMKQCDYVCQTKKEKRNKEDVKERREERRRK